MPTTHPQLSGFSLLSIEGQDAAAFLQAQTMNDLRELAPGQWQWNGWLNPKGRVIALFALLRQTEHGFITVLPDFPATELLPLLQRFVLRSKVKLRVFEEWVCAAEFDHTDQLEPAASHPSVTHAVLDFSSDSLRRRLWLVPPTDPAVADVDSANDQRWYRADLAHGLPRLPPSQRESWTPQMLSLERLNAYSLKKGCYPGQEIVARTHYLGQAKRGLARVQGNNISVGTELNDEHGAAIGQIICQTDDGLDGLAVIKLEPAPSTASLGSNLVNFPAFLSGLEKPSVKSSH